jgi:hypothetical protein
MPGITVVSPSGDTSGVIDTAAINAGFSAADRDKVVKLNPGHFYVNTPLTPGGGNELAGSGGGVNGVTSTGPSGTVIHPGTSFNGGAFISLAAGKGVRLHDFSILNDAGTGSGVDGIAGTGAVNGTQIENVSVALVTGHGVAFKQSGSGADGDGLKMRTVMIQRPGLNGVHRPVNDANIHDVHIQYAGQAGDATYKHGFYSTPGSSGNMSYVGCRADLCVGAGWVIDHKGTFGDATKLTGCSTERNGQDGVLITNTSASGSDWRAPVVIAGCCFEGDGTGIGPGGSGGGGGNYAGIRVRGKNRVFISGTITAVNTLDVADGCPKYALGINQAGSTNAQPETVEWASGRMNYSTLQGGQLIQNHALVDHLLIGPTVTVTGGYQDQTPTARWGTGTLSAGLATINNQWMYGNTEVMITPLSSPAGRLYVSSRSVGRFTVSSTSASDSCSFAWLIL